MPTNYSPPRDEHALADRAHELQRAARHAQKHAAASDHVPELGAALAHIEEALDRLSVAMLQMASGGYYRSTTHRVVNPTGEAALTSRYSMPLFLHPRPEVRLSETHTAGTYLDERLSEIGLKTQQY